MHQKDFVSSITQLWPLKMPSKPMALTGTVVLRSINGFPFNVLVCRVLIVDWDIHHGNGIQHMFECDKRVLYISLHRKDAFPFRPDDCDSNVVGSGPGAGFTVNIPWEEVM